MHYTAKLLPPAVFGKIKIFSENPFFFQNSSNCLILWEIWQSELHSSANMPPSVSFEKLQLFSEKTQLLNVLRNPCNTFAFEIKLAIFSLFQKNSIFFFKKTIRFFEKPKFWTSWESYWISCILHQICYHQHFLKISRFFSENPCFFATNQTLIVLRNLTGSFAFDIKLVNGSCFQKIEVFFQKKHLFSIFHKVNVQRNHNTSVDFMASLLLLAF